MPNKPRIGDRDMSHLYDLLDADVTDVYLDFAQSTVNKGYLLPHEASQIFAFVAGQLYSKAVWMAYGFLNETEDYSFEETAKLILKAMNEGSLYEAGRVKNGVHPQLGRAGDIGRVSQEDVNELIQKTIKASPNRRTENPESEDSDGR
jgi:hypothetical protein